MNRYTRIKAKRLARFERLGDYIIIVQPDKAGACITRWCVVNPQ